MMVKVKFWFITKFLIFIIILGTKVSADLFSKIQLNTELTGLCLKNTSREIATESVTECVLRCKRKDKASLMKDGYCYCVNEGCTDVGEKSSSDGNVFFFKPLSKTGSKESVPKEWEKLTNDGPVCYDARSVPASFKLKRSALIKKFKLVHVSGSVTCVNSQPGTHWGCISQHHAIAGQILTCITKENNQVIFPVNSINTDGSGISQSLVPGYDQNSVELILSAPNDVPYDSKVGEILKVWYTQALVQYSVDNNAGTHCVHVFVKYDY